MQQIGETLRALETFTPETESAQDSTRAAQVWVQLAELFGQAFYREHGDTPSRLWAQAVSRLTDQQIANGLANLGNDDLKFPANLSMFVAACKRQKPVRYLGVKALPASDDEAKLNAEKAWRGMEQLAGKSRQELKDAVEASQKKGVAKK